MIHIEKINETHSRVICEDRSVLMALNDLFSFPAKNHKFDPRYKARVWDGQIRLLSVRTGVFPSGLEHLIKTYAKENGIKFSTESTKKYVSSEKDIVDFCRNLKPCFGGSPIEHYDYQVSAIARAIQTEKCLLLSPTSSGKSLIIYSIVRWFSEQRILIIVPTVMLVNQLYADFEEYNNKQSSFMNDVHRQHAGKDKAAKSRIWISTYQSLMHFPPEWFEQFDVLICDEAHLYTSKVTKAIGEACSNAAVRIGTTGTLDDTETSEKTLVGLLGPVWQVTTTKHMMDTGRAADLQIYAVVLGYPDSDRKVKRDYVTEKEFVMSHEKRMKFLVRLSESCKGNTLVLVTNIEKHLTPLYNKLKQVSKKNVVTVYGATSAEVKEEIRQICEKSDNNIIVASYSTMSTGVSIKNLQNVIFGSSSKGKIRVLQSIGRGLRLDGKDNKITLYDIIDDLSWKSRKGHFVNHFEERRKHYEKEKFKYEIINADL